MLVPLEGIHGEELRLQIEPYNCRGLTVAFAQTFFTSSVALVRRRFRERFIVISELLKPQRRRTHSRANIRTTKASAS